MPRIVQKTLTFIPKILPQGHLEKIFPNELGTHPHFYLPHQCVALDDSTTTKMRIVFGASAKKYSGFCLIDCLMVGPIVQDDTFNVRIRFECFKVAQTLRKCSNKQPRRKKVKIFTKACGKLMTHNLLTLTL